MSELKTSLKERRIIEDNKQCARMIEKTQVYVPMNGRHEVIKNRLTHLYEVATSATVIAASVAESKGLDLYDIDYRYSVHNVSMLHDLGHPPFGHDGAELLDARFKAMGVKEGFSDNNNNLTVIEKNGIAVRDYLIASTIKYPDKLYESQKEKYMPMLERALEEDKAHYASLGINLSGQRTTIACQIMDEADRNSYTFTDMSDCLCMGVKIDVVDIVRIASQYGIKESDPMLQEFIEISQSGDKSAIKSSMSKFKEIANESYTLSDLGLEMTNPKIEMLREAINKMTMEFYIQPIRTEPFHADNMKKLNDVLDEMLAGRFLPSNHYRSVIEGADCEQTKLRAIRDMIGEVTDWYVLNIHDELSLDNKRERRPFADILLEARNVVNPKVTVVERENDSQEFSM